MQLIISDGEVSADGYDKQRRILLCKGPFISTRLAQSRFSGNSRPSAAILNAVMDNLATDCFGSVKNVERGTVFFKKLPADVTDEALARCEVQRERYFQAFNERTDKSIISRESFNIFLQESPNKDRLKEEHDITPEED